MSCRRWPPTASSASSNTSLADLGYKWYRSLPIPTNWEPWPIVRSGTNCQSYICFLCYSNYCNTWKQQCSVRLLNTSAALIWHFSFFNVSISDGKPVVTIHVLLLAARFRIGRSTVAMVGLDKSSCTKYQPCRTLHEDRRKNSGLSCGFNTARRTSTIELDVMASTDICKEYLAKVWKAYFCSSICNDRELAKKG